MPAESSPSPSPPSLAEHNTGTNIKAAAGGGEEPTSAASTVIIGLLLLLGLAIIAVRWHNRKHRGRAQYLPKMNHEFDFDDFEPLSSSR